MKECTMHMIIIAILLVAVVILGKLAYDKMQKKKDAEKKAAAEKKEEPINVEVATSGDEIAAEYYHYNTTMNQTQRMSPINPMDRSLGDIEIPSATPSKESFSLAQNLSDKLKK